MAMDFKTLIEIVGDEPVFETALFLAGDVDPVEIQRQLSRWKKKGLIFQLRRGLYALAPPFQRNKPHPFVVANRLVSGSYVTCQSALAFYGMIPEYVPMTISVTPTRPGHWDTPLGNFQFHHLKAELLQGCQLTELNEGQRAFIATPEKALLDLIYLNPGAEKIDYLRELRLQNLDLLNLNDLLRLAVNTDKPKMKRALKQIEALTLNEKKEYESL
jgi:predicted transcriptional regulator of viral defense system